MPAPVRTLCLIAAATLLSALTWPSGGWAEDWCQFRGPDGQGHSSATGLPTHWSATENVRWKTPIPGKGWSSPVTSGRRVFLTSAVPNGTTHALHALALDAATGKIEWDVTVFDGLVSRSAQMHPKNSHASPTPVTDGKRVFVHFGSQGTACLTTEGAIVWKTREIEYLPLHGGGGSPVLVDGLLVFSCDGSDVQFVVALDAGTGKLRWKSERPRCNEARRYAFATPLVIDAHGQKQMISPGAHLVVAYNAQTGAEIWTARYKGDAVVPRPVFGNGLVYFATGYMSSVLLAVRPDGRGDVTESGVAWRQSRSIPYNPSPLLIGENLFLINDEGIASCLDAKTGHPRWTHRVGGNFSASPLFADDKIYIQSEAGQTTIFRPNPDRYVAVATNALNEQTLATPAVLDHSLLVRTASALYRIEEAPPTQPSPEYQSARRESAVGASRR
jgi:outer membrane protein assembly factor BamB